jgi:hypothetical protein
MRKIFVRVGKAVTAIKRQTLLAVITRVACTFSLFVNGIITHAGTEV